MIFQILFTKALLPANLISLQESYNIYFDYWETLKLSIYDKALENLETIEFDSDLEKQKWYTIKVERSVQSFSLLLLLFQPFTCDSLTAINVRKCSRMCSAVKFC